MRFLTTRNKTVFIPIILGLSLSAQTTGFNPFSRYALGERIPVGVTSQQALAASGIALQTDTLPPTVINLTNPAAFSGIRYTALDMGTDIQFQRVQQHSKYYDYNNIRLLNAVLALPIKKHSGLVLGIIPYSQSGYNLIQTEISSAGTTTQQVQAYGGWNSAFIGFGTNPFSRRYLSFRYRNYFVPDSIKRFKGVSYAIRKTAVQLISELSLGAQASWLFGSIDQTSRLIYPNSILYNNTLTRNALSVNGYLLHSGIQTGFTIDSTLSIGHRRALKHPIRVGFGYSAQLPTPLNPVQQLDVYSYILTNGNETIRDTIYNASEIIPTLAPFEQGLGMGIKSGEIWQWNIDFQTADWSNTRLRMTSNTYSKVFRVASGFQFQPDKQAFGKGTFLKRTVYRAGIQYQNGPISIHSSVVSDWNINIGVGLPLGQSKLFNALNVAFRFGQYGIKGQQITYGRIFLGCTFQDRWFLKYKYD
ncbi:MAG: hypothetical protein ACO259_09385 [Bacteroidia bacterium]|jgi:hypothetical protein|nr:hypothetical protein [Sphingobacteriia bacterium]